MSHRKTDLGIPRPSKSAKVVLAAPPGVAIVTKKAHPLQFTAFDRIYRWQDAGNGQPYIRLIMGVSSFT
jgi:hypothetical protein